VLEVFS